MNNNTTPIPGLSFSLKRALSITQAKQKIAKVTGIPTSKAGLERKIGSVIVKMLVGKKHHRRWPSRQLYDKRRLIPPVGFQGISNPVLKIVSEKATSSLFLHPRRKCLRRGRGVRFGELSPRRYRWRWSNGRRCLHG